MARHDVRPGKPIVEANRDKVSQLKGTARQCSSLANEARELFEELHNLLFLGFLETAARSGGGEASSVLREGETAGSVFSELCESIDSIYSSLLPLVGRLRACLQFVRGE